MPDSTSPQRTSPVSPFHIAAAAILLSVALLQCWWLRAYVVDDAFISFRYSERWAAGAGPVYNLGERVEGYTNFAWVALLALTTRLGIDVVLAAKIGGCVFALLTLVLTFRVGARLQRDGGPLLFVAPTLLASNTIFFRNAVNGLETGMFACLAMWAVDQLEDVRRGSTAAIVCMAAALTGLGLTRPDGILWAIPIGALALVPRRGKEENAPTAWWKAALPGLACLLVLGAHEAWRIGYYGQPFPNTYYAKLAGQDHLELWKSGVSQLYYFQGILGGIAVACGCLVAVFADTSRIVRALVLLTGIRLAFVLYTGGQAMENHRFMAPCLPAIYLLLQAAACWVWRLAGRPRLHAVAVAVVVLPLVGWNVYAGRLSLRSADHYAEALQRAHVVIGRYLATQSPPDAVVAVGDAGAIPYYSGRTAIDLYGLADAHIARLPGRYGDKFDIDYLWSRRPDYIVIWSSVPGREYRYASGRSEHDRVIEASERFRRDYEPVGDAAFEAGSYHLLFRRKPGAL